jgi:hypothetical protein
MMLYSFSQPIPLYTTASSYPWYHTLKPVTLSLPMYSHSSEQHQDKDDPSSFFQYRYVIHRAGAFFRVEQPNDAPSDKELDDAMEDNDEERNDKSKEEDKNTTTMQVDAAADSSSSFSNLPFHQLPLRLLSHRESYVVNDVLGKVGTHPDIDHITVPNTQVVGSCSASLHKQQLTRLSVAAPGATSSSPGGPNTDDVVASSTTTSTTTERKKAVGFAPAPPTYHPHPPAPNQPPISTTTATTSTPPKKPSPEAVHLNSTDGLVVVSAFLPIVLHRSDAGQWTADWDYEALLSMQTHLRVTRVGVVKWRGWHGNVGTGSPHHPGSAMSGVPIPERHLVEECLRPFHCVPVWIDTAVFGEM